MKKKMLFILISLISFQTFNLQAALPMRWFYPLSALTLAAGAAIGGITGHQASQDKEHKYVKDEQKKRKAIGTSIGTVAGLGLGAIGTYLLYRCTPSYLIKHLRFQFGHIETNIQQDNSQLITTNWQDEQGFTLAFGADRFQVSDASQEQFKSMCRSKLSELERYKNEVASIQAQINGLGSDIEHMDHPNHEKIQLLTQEINKRMQQANQVLVYFDLYEVQRLLDREQSQVVLGVGSANNDSSSYPDLTVGYGNPIEIAFNTDMSNVPLYKYAIGFDRLTSQAHSLERLSQKCNEIAGKSSLWAQSTILQDVRGCINRRIHNVQHALAWLQEQEGFQEQYEGYQDRENVERRHNEKLAEKERYHSSIETIERGRLDEARKQTAEVRKQTQKLETLESELARVNRLVEELEREQRRSREAHLLLHAHHTTRH